MYGAILGDIIGSPYEFDRGAKIKSFPLFVKKSRFTDDTVMTVAVADALLYAGKEGGEDKVTSAVVSSMQRWGRKYPKVGYGGNFREWLKEKNPMPYSSFGNGSAMRVSTVGWLYGSIERTREVARWSAEVTHNHPEGIKGAESIASAIYRARMGESKETIKNYIEDEFGYNLSRTLQKIRPVYHMDVTCQGSVPEAIIESARIDGSGEWRTLIQIVCPLAIPGFATVGLFSAIGIWNDFRNCLLLNDSAQYYNLQYTIYQTMNNLRFLKENASRMGGVNVANLPAETFRMAMAVVTVGPIIMAYPFFQRYFVKGLTVGAVKG
jgi:hypothetical protein